MKNIEFCVCLKISPDQSRVLRAILDHSFNLNGINKLIKENLNPDGFLTIEFVNYVFDRVRGKVIPNAIKISASNRDYFFESNLRAILVKLFQNIPPLATDINLFELSKNESDYFRHKNRVVEYTCGNVPSYLQWFETPEEYVKHSADVGRVINILKHSKDKSLYQKAQCLTYYLDWMNTDDADILRNCGHKTMRIVRQLKTFIKN